MDAYVIKRLVILVMTIMVPLCHGHDYSVQAGIYSSKHQIAAASTSNTLDHEKKVLPPNNCLKDDLPCEQDRAAFQVISEIHSQLDDDKDGGVDPSEADGFFRDELHYGGTGSSDRSRRFYRNDQHVSVVELWIRWKESPVYNWTTEDVLHWLEYHVELPQYKSVFSKQRIDGPSIPKLAMSNGYFLTSVLQVRNPVHRRKILLKSIDAILFGPPRQNHNYVKDGILTALLLVSLGGCWFAYVQYKRSQTSLVVMTQELDALSRKEESLIAVTQRLEEAERRQEIDLREKSKLEERYRKEVEEARAEAKKLACERQSTAEIIDQLRLTEQELELVKKMLAEAERKLELGEGMCPGFGEHVDLLMLLQLTYEMEVKYHNVKRGEAENQLVQARENCEKVRRKRAAFMGSLRIAHSSTLDDVDRSITEAKGALEEVKNDLQERQFRWSKIEEITGLRIMCNSGLEKLRKELAAAKLRGFRSDGSHSHLLAPSLRRQDRVDEPPAGLTPGAGEVAFDVTPTNHPRHRRRPSDEAPSSSTEDGDVPTAKVDVSARGSSVESGVESMLGDTTRPRFSVDDTSSQSSNQSGDGAETAEGQRTPRPTSAQVAESVGGARAACLHGSYSCDHLMVRPALKAPVKPSGGKSADDLMDDDAGGKTSSASSVNDVNNSSASPAAITTAASKTTTLAVAPSGSSQSHHHLLKGSKPSNPLRSLLRRKKHAAST